MLMHIFARGRRRPAESGSRPGAPVNTHHNSLFLFELIFAHFLGRDGARRASTAIDRLVPSLIHKVVHRFRGQLQIPFAGYRPCGFYR